MKLVQFGSKPKNEIAETEYHQHKVLTDLSTTCEELKKTATSEARLNQPESQILIGIISATAESMIISIPEVLSQDNKNKAKDACNKIITLCNDYNLDLEKLKGFPIQLEVLKRALKR